MSDHPPSVTVLPDPEEHWDVLEYMRWKPDEVHDSAHFPQDERDALDVSVCILEFLGYVWRLDDTRFMLKQPWQKTAPAIGSQSDLPMLSTKAAKTRELLLEQPDHSGLTAPQIVDALHKRGVYTDDSTLRSRILPKLKPYGLDHTKRIGYRIRPSARPST